MATFHAAEGRGADGLPERDAGSVRVSGAVESAASRDADALPSPFGRHLWRTAKRFAFAKPVRWVSASARRRGEQCARASSASASSAAGCGGASPAPFLALRAAIFNETLRRLLPVPRSASLARSAGAAKGTARETPTSSTWRKTRLRPATPRPDPVVRGIYRADSLPSERRCPRSRRKAATDAVKFVLQGLHLNAISLLLVQIPCLKEVLTVRRARIHL